MKTAKTIETAKGAKVYERVLRGINPGTLTDSALSDELRRMYWPIKGLRCLPDDHPIATLRPVLKAQQDRLWEEYKRRFMHGDRWPDERGPDYGIVTPAGFRKAYCDPARLREESMRELRHTALVYRDGGPIEYIDPLRTLQSAELHSADREYLALVEAEIARRERRRGRKAA